MKLVLLVCCALMALGGLWTFRNARTLVNKSFFDMRDWPNGNRPTFVAKPGIRDRYDPDLRLDRIRFVGVGWMIIGLGGLLMTLVL
jgi:hypothetical protein